MKSTRVLPPEMLKEIEATIEAFKTDILPIYSEAEKIRRRWLEQNVALEDIVDQILHRCTNRSVAFAFIPEQAADALSGEEYFARGQEQPVRH